MEGKSILNRNMSEIVQILDQECTRILLRSLIQMFEGPLLLYLQKSANLLWTCRPTSLLPLHTITAGTQFLLLQAPSQVWNPSPTWHKPICATASSLGFHYPYSISLPRQPKAVWNSCPGTCPPHVIGLIFFFLFRKYQETSLEWSRFPQCRGHFPIFSTKKSPGETSSVLCSFFPIMATLLLLGDLPTPC